jgi:hypothetical protein
MVEVRLLETFGSVYFSAIDERGLNSIPLGVNGDRSGQAGKRLIMLGVGSSRGNDGKRTMKTRLRS